MLRKSDWAKVKLNNLWQDFPVQSIMSKVKHVPILRVRKHVLVCYL
jgi:hypothetical protein